jgi:hypothetical protein
MQILACELYAVHFSEHKVLLKAADQKLNQRADVCALLHIMVTSRLTRVYICFAHLVSVYTGVLSERSEAKCCVIQSIDHHPFDVSTKNNYVLLSQ